MKRIVLVMIAVMILTGCSHTLGGVDSEQKINYSIINNILNTVKEQNYSKLSEMFTVDASSLKRYEVDENMKSVFEKSTYEIVSYEKFDDKILTKVSIDMPFSQELSNVAVMMIMNKTTKENGTPDFTISSEEKEKIWKDAFYEQLNSEIGARVQCEYEVVLVKKDEKWVVDNEPDEFLAIFFGHYVENYTDYWYEENEDYYDIWVK